MEKFHFHTCEIFKSLISSEKWKFSIITFPCQVKNTLHRSNHCRQVWIEYFKLIYFIGQCLDVKTKEKEELAALISVLVPVLVSVIVTIICVIGCCCLINSSTNSIKKEMAKEINEKGIIEFMPISYLAKGNAK